ncbi:hypothetical protein FB45DRAFT_1051156 [Roridomyces roridus]|uniref:Uncharacterized protein n=1 Tax=Roridomyces roridus TaxID=1738132 RepID=A0AAD7FZJ9_9AGAR|nr:hypothetical protein FB45DRAFT_1051156 [Roridomyces roridus]
MSRLLLTIAVYAFPTSDNSILRRAERGAHHAVNAANTGIDIWIPQLTLFKAVRVERILAHTGEDANLPSVAFALALLSQVVAAVSTTRLQPVQHAASTSGPPVASSPPGTLTSVDSFVATPRVRASSFAKRAAIPACLSNVELSCLNMAANCIDSVGMDTSFINNLWGVQSCVAAATCYGVGDLITSVECQTGLSTTNTAQASLDYDNIYAGIVGSCAFAPGGCPITQQNYIDFYYGELTAINSANFPVSNDVVIAWWNAITAWAATGPTVPYLNFNDWLHFSSAPSTTTTVPPPVPSFTQIEWSWRSLLWKMNRDG